MLNARKQKLELTWIGKDNRPKLEPRILLEDPANSYHAKHRVTEDDVFDNKLIFGDNLLALKALEQEFVTKLREGLGQLPEEWRTAVVLRDIEGLSTEEAAAVVGLRPAAFKSRLHRGRMQLRRLLEPYLDLDIS